MALSSSPDWWSVASLAWIPCNSSKEISTSRRTPLCSLPRFNSRDLNLIAARSSTCPSPLFEDNNALSSASKSQPTIMDLTLSEYQPEDLNNIIFRLIKNPQTAESGSDFYAKAKGNPGFIPEKSTLTLLTRYFMRSRKWSSIFSLAQDFRAFNVIPDSGTFCRLISSCARARKFKIVNTLLESAFFLQETPLAFEHAMRGYNKLHMYSTTILLYQRMKSSGLVLEPGCYCTTMEAYHNMGQYEEVVSLFQEFKHGRRLESTQYNSKIYLCLCNSLGKMGRTSESLDHFREMTSKGVPDDHKFYSSLISAFATSREVEMAEELLEEAVRKKMLSSDPSLFMKLVLMYIDKEGMLEKALSVISLMKRLNIRVSDCISCAIVNAFSRKLGPEEAVRVFEEELQFEGCEPGQVTYALILNIYCQIKLYSKAEAAFADMEQKGFVNCSVSYSTMINMYGKTGRHREAMMILAKMKKRGCKPNVWIYNSLLDIHRNPLNLRQVEKTWKEMERRGVLPDRVSYTSIISAYNKAKEYQRCVEYYNDFRKLKNGDGKIDRAMGGLMVGVFSKMNRGEELVKVLQEMKKAEAELDERLYWSALNALRDAGLEIHAKWLQDSFAII
ncbi:unnamed protein product [Cuscuta epithymum]|uniref:Pentatricopeptide repeat-containing protein n=1 Tax=Cuscuta epithymum TaxID=186058 RepID=A0AAV0GIY9_9ASTE|nr:unnamed protein product [Cuscuta epithymum]